MLTEQELPPIPDYLSPGTVREYARAVERAAYEAAIKACRGEMVDAVATESREDESYNMAIDHCADAIRSLIQEQPK